MNNVVQEIQKLNFDGNIIPHTFYQNIKFPNGKPNLVAIHILSEILWWYRPVVVKDERTGKFLGYKKKFKADKLQKHYEDFAQQFGFTRRQVKENVDRLVEQNFITREFRIIEINGRKYSNVMFVEPVTLRIRQLLELHSDILESEGVVHSNAGGSSAETKEGDTFKSTTYTEITNREYNTKKKLKDFDSEFLSFWEIYPVKVSKQGTHKVYTKILASSPEPLLLHQRILSAVENQIKTRHQKELKKEFIPAWKHPTTWLNQGCWEDETPDVSDTNSEFKNVNVTKI